MSVETESGALDMSAERVLQEMSLLLTLPREDVIDGLKLLLKQNNFLRDRIVQLDNEIKSLRSIFSAKEPGSTQAGVSTVEESSNNNCGVKCKCKNNKEDFIHHSPAEPSTSHPPTVNEAGEELKRVRFFEVLDTLNDDDNWWDDSKHVTDNSSKANLCGDDSDCDHSSTLQTIPEWNHVFDYLRLSECAINAVLSDSFHFMQTLLCFEVDVNTTDSDGNTLLILAAQRNSQTMCTLLIESGADVNQQNNLGLTAFRCSGSRELRAYLQSKERNSVFFTYN